MIVEQIKNGGFEIGNLDDWIVLTSGAIKDDSEYHSGASSAKFPNASGAEIYQIFNPIPQAWIETFEFYYKTTYFYPAWGTGAFILYEGWSAQDPYNENYTTPIAIYTALNWSLWNLKEALESAKGKVIGLMLRSVGAADYWVDDVSLEASISLGPLVLVKMEITDDESVTEGNAVWEEIETVDAIRWGERFEVYRFFPIEAKKRKEIWTGKHYWEIEFKCEKKPDALFDANREYLAQPRKFLGKPDLANPGTALRVILKDEAGYEMKVYFGEVMILDFKFEKGTVPNIGRWAFKAEAGVKSDIYVQGS